MAQWFHLWEYPNPKHLIQKNISTSMLIVALFTIAKIWKQPKCPLVSEP